VVGVGLRCETSRRPKFPSPARIYLKQGDSPDLHRACRALSILRSEPKTKPLLASVTMNGKTAVHLSFSSSMPSSILKIAGFALSSSLSLSTSLANADGVHLLKTLKSPLWRRNLSLLGFCGSPSDIQNRQLGFFLALLQQIFTQSEQL